METKTPKVQVQQEVRFAVVMYGGVSLAIYINGVTQELFRMVRATASSLEDKETPLIDQPVGTERVYRQLGQMLGHDERPRDEDPIRTRFLVDILSGTSAGGINAIYLAKALANNQEIEQLKDLWIEEGDLEKLINDEHSVKDLTNLVVQKPPKSLLNSQRMYNKLLKAFNGMEEGDGDSKANESPYIRELDLFVTATDIRGLPIYLRLSDGIVWEKRHRNVFHFKYSDGHRSDICNDFHEDNNPFLAFVARCTSAFPLAFEPMKLEDTGVSDYERWKEFFPDYLQPPISSPFLRNNEHNFVNCAFGDGGYLDNKPFSYATEALVSRRSGLPSKRKLLYIEPSPEQLEPQKQDSEAPNAIENVAAALSLARYETIREDIQRIVARNRLTERARSVISGMESDIRYWRNRRKQEAEEDEQAKQQQHMLNFDNPFTSEDYAQLGLKEMIEQGGIGYGGYHRLKVAALTDEITAVIARAAGFDTQSDEFLAIRYLVRAWREEKYTEERQEAAPQKATQNQFLLQFDLAYRVRRLEFVLNKIDQLYSLEEKEAEKILNHYKAMTGAGIGEGLEQPLARSQEKDESRQELKELETKLGEVFVILRRARKRLDLPGKKNPLYKAVLATKLDRDQLRTSILTKPTDLERLQCAKEMVTDPKRAKEFDEFADKLANYIGERTERASRTCTQILKQKKIDNQPRTFFAEAKDVARYYYDFYEHYDSILYPILQTTETGEEFETVEVVRVSPPDAPSIVDEQNGGRRKLAGTSLRNFGAFLDRGWRRNDILWGRLDGAERIIRTLLAGSKHESEGDRLIHEAHCEILKQELKLNDRNELCRLLVNTITGTPDPEDMSEKQLRDLVEQQQGSPINSTLKTTLKASLEPEALLEFLGSNDYKINEMNPRTAARTLSRSTKVVGSMLDDMSSGYSSAGRRMAAWITRFGRVSWGLVEVSAPRSLPRELFRYWLMLLYLFEVLLIVGGTVFVKPDVQLLGLTAFGITLATHFGTMILGDYMGGKGVGLLNFLKFILIGAVLLLAAVGAHTLIQNNMRNALGERLLTLWQGLEFAPIFWIFLALVGTALIVLTLVGTDVVFDLRGKWRRLGSRKTKERERPGSKQQGAEDRR